MNKAELQDARTLLTGLVKLTEVVYRDGQPALFVQWLDGETRTFFSFDAVQFSASLTRSSR